ncbi:MAG: Xanthine and dehydrogenase maturation factor XdhC/CoxF family-like protein [Flaviaesturariibacter sp.]|nr:Xanthine and dehydrogenase maturation factor XdhC/CoxF family-like protein [Flaviaesturariibacter sp.]
MEVWLFIREKLTADIPVILLWVLESEGSSPGRSGFKLAVSADGSFNGTIGGGIMEHKLVEKARSLFGAFPEKPFLMRQYHDKEHSKDQSGMICSGSQLIAFVPLLPSPSALINDILSEQQSQSYIKLSPTGLEITNETFATEIEDSENWYYSERIDQRPVVHIVGGGHVGLALSELLSYLGFYIHLYDNRPELNTVLQNGFAHKKHTVDYETISKIIKGSPDEYLVIMTFGYRDDKTVFRQLVGKPFFYAGMLGSEEKIATLFQELQDEGITPDQWRHWHIPIGLNIFSKTPREIAVSIAAEMIREKNKALPTGRMKTPAAHD